MSVTCHSSRPPMPANTSSKARDAEQGPDQDHAQAEPEVADPVDDERLLGRSGGRRLLVPVADEQVRAQADRLPADVQEQEVVGQDQQQHAEHEQVQVGEEAPHAPVAVHVADGVDVDQEADRAHHQEQDRGQRVHEERDLDPEVARHDPLVDGDPVLLAAEDDRSEHDHGRGPHERDEGDRYPPRAVDRARSARRHVARLAPSVVQLVRDDPVGAVRVGQVVGVAAVGRGLALLLLGRDRAERGLVHRLVMGRVRVAARVVPGPRSVALPVVAVGRDPVQARPEQDREDEADQRQGRDERDQLLGGQRPTPSGPSTRQPRGSDESG